MQKVFPGWDYQVVLDPRQAEYTAAGPVAENAPAERGAMGPLSGALGAVVGVAIDFRRGRSRLAIRPLQRGGRPRRGDGAGGGWPIAVAAVAGIVFLLGALVLVHAARTGDFLGFLPDSVRGAAEGALGVPPPPSGENTRWDLRRQSWLPGIADETWLAGLLAIGAVAMIFFTYRGEGPTIHPAYKVLLGGLRIFLILLTMSVLLPQLQLRFDRQGWPDVVVLIDDSRSMGEPDVFQDEKIRDRAKGLGEPIKKRLLDTLPDKIKALEADIAAKTDAGSDTPHAELNLLKDRLRFWQNQLATVNSAAWNPTRLQLVQALLAQPNPDWLGILLNERRSKIHVYHLDHEARGQVER